MKDDREINEIMQNFFEDVKSKEYYQEKEAVGNIMQKIGEFASAFYNMSNALAINAKVLKKNPELNKMVYDAIAHIPFLPNFSKQEQFKNASDKIHNYMVQKRKEILPDE